MSRRRAFGREKEGRSCGLPSDAEEAVGKCRTDRGTEGERKRNEEERDFDFSSGEKVANHGEFVFEASPSSHERDRGGC